MDIIAATLRKDRGIDLVVPSETDSANAVDRVVAALANGDTCFLHDWSLLYPEREQCLVEAFRCSMPERALGRCLDVSEPINHDRVAGNGLAPTFLRTHKYHVFGLAESHDGRCTGAPPEHGNDKANRFLLGSEMLWALGFPRDLRLHELSDPQVRSLAGNSMSVHHVATLQAVVLCFVDFATPLDQLRQQQRGRGKRVTPLVSAASAAPSVTIPPHAYTPLHMVRKTSLPGLERTADGKRRAVSCNILSPLTIVLKPITEYSVQDVVPDAIQGMVSAAVGALLHGGASLPTKKGRFNFYTCSMTKDIQVLSFGINERDLTPVGNVRNATLGDHVLQLVNGFKQLLDEPHQPQFVTGVDIVLTRYGLPVVPMNDKFNNTGPSFIFSASLVGGLTASPSYITTDHGPGCIVWQSGQVGGGAERDQGAMRHSQCTNPCTGQLCTSTMRLM